MSKIFEDANDQHVRNIIVYGKTADHKLYTTSAKTTQVAQAVVEDAFAKGMLLVQEGDVFLVPIALDGNKVTTAALAGSPAAITGVEWTAKATSNS